MGKVERAHLPQHWVHSHEEDTAEEMVFRPATFPFPRSRGRASFELGADGQLVEHGIGPTDRREASQGTWSLEGDDGLAFSGTARPGSRRVMRILSVEKDRLVIRK